MKKEIICKKQLISVLGGTKWTTGKDVECEYCPHCGSPHIIIMKAFSKIIGFVQTVAHVVRWIAQPLVTKRSNSFITIFIECECCESGTLTVMY